jgi:hypothetical protein
LVGDSLRLGQVLLNLVGNAIKFTERGEVTLSIRLEDTAAPNPNRTITLRFDVIDSGVGLSKEQCEKLFSAFSQADASTTRRYGGTGLGLTISKRLVELMDGEISVHSVVGDGSTFSFTARFELQDRQSVRPPLNTDVTGLRVLVVDDNACTQNHASHAALTNSMPWPSPAGLKRCRRWNKPKPGKGIRTGTDGLDDAHRRRTQRHQPHTADTTPDPYTRVCHGDGTQP